MHALPLALLLAASQAAGLEEPKAAAAPAAAPSPAAAATLPPAAAPLPPAVIEKMGQGDRAFLERDFRTALFAYMDAAYLAPASAVPRVKLGRAYLALRHPARAVEQAEKALAMDPENADAKRLVEEARSAAASLPEPAAPPPATPSSAAPGPRVFRFVPEPEAAPPPAPGAPPAPASAAQRYREGLEHLRSRDFEKAVAAFGEAVSLDPRLAVAYGGRASARFALGAYREAADDYRAAIRLDAKLATPIYGLAECLRALGQTKDAADMYRRYAESSAVDVRDDLRGLAAKRAQELK